MALLGSPLFLFALSSPEVSLTVRADQVVHTMRGGLGASWHAIEEPIPVVGSRSHGGSAWGGHPPAEDRARWEQIEQHADWLGLDFIRVEVEQRMWQPERDRFTWDTAEMRILYRILDWCERCRADVFFQVMWGNVDWNAFPEFRGDAVKRVHSGPRDMQAFADSVAALLKHLTRTKRYTCIRWLCINNEPGYDWSWWQAPPNQPMPLRDGLAAVRHALDREGIRVPLSGPDWTDLPELKPEQIDFDEFIGAYDLHSYYARFDWASNGGYPLATAEKRLAAWREWTSARGKPLFLSELGTMVYGWGGNKPGPAKFESAIKDAELVVRALNLGVDGFNRWSFVNRGDLDGHWQMISTWDENKQTLLQTIMPHPNSYFVYGLVSRLTAKHSSVLACEARGGRVDGTNRVFTTALRSPKGNLTWMVVNDASRAWAAQLEISGVSGQMLHKYQVTSEQRDQPTLRIQPLNRIELTKGAATFSETLPAMSLTVYSTFDLGHSARGVVVE
jgi:alpha-galactosidase